jgi:hypothetical protein
MLYPLSYGGVSCFSPHQIDFRGHAQFLTTPDRTPDKKLAAWSCRQPGCHVEHALSSVRHDRQTSYRACTFT